MNFNFDESVVVTEVVGLGTHTPEKGFDRMMIFSPGLRKPVEINLSEVHFIISDEVAAHTFAPCYDVDGKVMAFQNEDTLVSCFRKWQINLNLIIPEDEQTAHTDNEITLTDATA